MNSLLNVPVITIDGPSGSGKGTISQMVAQALHWHFLDSGTLYRVLALHALKKNLDEPNHSLAQSAYLQRINQLVQLANQLPVTFVGEEATLEAQVLLENQNVTSEIRTEKCSELASKIAAIPEVRLALLERQRAFRQPPGLVADGRDMGTVVFPDATVKIFLDAELQERANRRIHSCSKKG